MLSVVINTLTKGNLEEKKSLFFLTLSGNSSSLTEVSAEVQAGTEAETVGEH